MNTKESFRVGTVMIYQRVNADLSNPSELRLMTIRDEVELDIIEAAQAPNQISEYVDDLIISASEDLAKYRGPLATIDLKGVVVFRTWFEPDDSRMLVMPIWARGVNNDQLALVSQGLGTVRFMWSELYKRMIQFISDTEYIWYNARSAVADLPVCRSTDFVYTVDRNLFESRYYEELIIHDKY